MGRLPLTLCLTFLVMATVTFGVPPKKAVDVPFGRNYFPTWAFDHIKYLNGGSEVHLILDKYTGEFLCLLINFSNKDITKALSDCSCSMRIRHWLSVQRFLLVWTLQYAHKDGSWGLCWNCDRLLRKWNLLFEQIFKLSTE